jgi:hypothetical protein
MVVWLMLVGCAHWDRERLQDSFELPDDGEILVLQNRWTRSGQVLSARVAFAVRQDGDVIWCENALEWRHWTMVRMEEQGGPVLAPFGLGRGDCQAVWWGDHPSRVTVFGPGTGATTSRVELVVEPTAFRAANAQIQQGLAVMFAAR